MHVRDGTGTAPGAAAGPPLRILFVEDVAADAEMAERALRKEAIDVTSLRVQSRSGLLEALDAFRPDVVISDYAMPAFNGLEALNLTLAHDPGLPFILLTGAVSEETAVACMKAGATDYVLKERAARLPFAVREALDRRQARLDSEEAERALRESELRYRTLADSGQALIWTSGLDKKCNYLNQTWLWFTGRSLEQELGDGWVEGVHPDDLDHCLSTYAQAFDRREPFSMDYRLRDHRGEYRWIQDDGTPRYDTSGRFLGYIGHCLDITERKLAQEALRESEERFRGLYENATIGMYRTTPDGRIIMANPALVRMLGYDDFQDLATRNLEEEGYEPGYLRANFLREMEEKGVVSGLEASWKRKDGTAIFVRESARALRDAGGNLLYYDGTVEDFTERKQAEEALRGSEEVMRYIVKHDPNAIAVYDRNLHYLAASDRYLQDYNVSSEDIIGKHHYEVFPEMPQRWKGVHQRCLAGAIERNDDDSFERPDGSITYNRWECRPWYGADGKIGGIITYTEVTTTRKLAEEALRQSEDRFRRVSAITSDIAYSCRSLEDDRFAIEWIVGAASRITGYTTDEIKSMGCWRSLVVEEDQTLFERNVIGLAPGTRGSCELRIRHRNGDIVWIDSFAECVSEAGAPGGLLLYGGLVDITNRKRTEKAERDQRQWAEALADAAATLNRTLDLDQVLDTILENAGKVVPHDASEVLLLTPQARVRDVRHRGYEARGLEDWAASRDFPLSDFPILQRVADTRQPQVIPDTVGFPGWVPVPEMQWIRSYICAPIVGKGQVIGFIRLAGTSPGMFDLEHARRLNAFADQAAVALENANLFAQVRTGREQLRLLSRRLLEAQEMERRHVARELHDEVGQLLTGLKLVLQMTAASAPKEQKGGLDEAEALVSELMARVRQLSLDLRPAMLDDLGLLPALLWHMPRYSQQTGVAVQFKHTGIEGRRLAPEVETAAYRIVQEALTNVARHSGVTRAAVCVWGDAESLIVQVDDEGAGFDPEALLSSGKTSGLTGIRERVVLLGGQLTVSSTPGQGAHLTATLPVGDPARRRAAKH